MNYYSSHMGISSIDIEPEYQFEATKKKDNAKGNSEEKAKEEPVAPAPAPATPAAPTVAPTAPTVAPAAPVQAVAPAPVPAQEIGGQGGTLPDDLDSDDMPF